ncbi:MAG: TlpA family protein disulfide reductase [Gammaproteobacteria bacterium]|nr:TlpA family protein disulfide reductase [Gammaproteobacteria bacterium]
MDEKIYRLADLRGKVVLINFWATWCPPCRKELPSMERLWQQFSKEDFMVLAINVGEDADTIFAFTGTLEPALGFPLLLDRDSAVLKAWPVRGLPTTFVLDREGRVVYRAVGGREFDNPELVAQLRGLLQNRR